MKKIFLLSATLFLSLLSMAQAPFLFTEGQSAIVYSLPKTQLCIEVVTEKTTQQPGIFYRYSERYLATNNVITLEKTAYKLKNIGVKAVAIPDPKRTFSVIPAKNSQLSKISVNGQGILCGVNVQVKQGISKLPNTFLPQKETEKTTALLPLGEEYMMAGSEAKLAEGAAKQIYRIRESRLSLLTADVEKLPADGASFKSMLDGMNKMEKELTELFVGKANTEIQVETINLTPDSTVTNQVIFRFSALRGLVAADDLSGVPYFISVKPTIIPVAAVDPKAKPEKVGIYTVLPATTEISITDGVNTSFSGQYLVPQFGKVIPLPESLFHQKQLKISVDCQTGRLLEIN